MMFTNLAKSCGKPVNTFLVSTLDMLKVQDVASDVAVNNPKDTEKKKDP
jgi:hypothetical protein